MGKRNWACGIALVACLSLTWFSRSAAAASGGTLAPIPSPANQDRAQKVIRDAFRADYARPDRGDQTSLAKKLIDRGKNTSNDPVSKFVFFREASDVAASAGDFNLAFTAIDELSAVFAVNANEMKSLSLVAAAPKAQSDEENAAVAKAALALSDAAVAGGQLAVATRLLPVADAAARKASSVALLDDVLSKTRELEEVQRDPEHHKPATAPATEKPVKAAQKPSVMVTTPVVTPPPPRMTDGPKAIVAKPVVLKTAKPSEKPIVKVAAPVQKTIDDRPVINLLPLVNPVIDTETGKWQIIDGKVVTDTKPEERAIVRLPYIPEKDESYDFHFGYVLHSPTGHVCGLALHQSARFDVVIGSADFGVENVDGKDYLHNKALEKLSLSVEAHHDCLIRVRSTKIQVCVDGRILVEVGAAKLSEGDAWKRASDALCLAAEGGRVEFDVAEVIEVGGKGIFLRPASPEPAPSASPPAEADVHRKDPGLVAGFTTVSHIETADIAPKGHRLCVGTSGLHGSHLIVDVDAGKLVKRSSGAAFTPILPDGQHVLVVDGALKILDLETAKDVTTLGPDTRGEKIIAPDRTRLFAFGAENLVLYDLKDNKKISDIKISAMHGPKAISPAGDAFAAGADDHQLHLWNAETGQEVWQVPDEPTARLIFTKDGTHLLRVPSDAGAGLELLSTSTGQVQAKWGGWDGQCVDAAMSQKTKYLVAAVNGGGDSLRLFKLDAKQQSATVNPVAGWPSGDKNIGGVNAVAFAPKGDTLLAACQDGKVRLINVKGEVAAVFDHGGEPLRVSFSSDGHYAVSANDATVRVWKLP